MTVSPTPRRRAGAMIAAATCAVASLPVAAAEPAAPEMSSSSSALSSAISSAPLLDPLGRPSAHILAALEDIAHSPNTPEQLSDALGALVAFIRGGGTPGAKLPTNGPAFTQFAWPAIARDCIGGELQAVAPAIAVPGPADLPLPGIPAGHTGFILTVLGTGPVADQQAPGTQPPRVHWINLTTGATGSDALGFHGINPQGPATVSTTSATGGGLVAAAITPGVVTTKLGAPAGQPAGVSACRISPTAALITVPDAPEAPPTEAPAATAPESPAASPMS